MNYCTLYIKENIKSMLVSLVKRKLGRLGTSMDYVITTLRAKHYLAENAEAIELFGMFGLWHTKDYINYVSNIDFFDIDNDYIKYARRVFDNKSKVTFYNEDSIKFIQKTDKKYDLVIADTPYSATFFYDDNDLPVFLKDMLRVTKQGGVVIFNIHTDSLNQWDMLKDKIIRESDRSIKDIFVLYRSNLVSYVVIVFED